MTLPTERFNSVGRTREFLRSLLDPKATPRVPRSVRKDAYWCLRHFPSDFDLARAKDQYDDVFNSGIPDETENTLPMALGGYRIPRAVQRLVAVLRRLWTKLFTRRGRGQGRETD